MADDDYRRLAAACFCGNPRAEKAAGGAGRRPVTCQDHRRLPHRAGATCPHPKPLLLNGRERMACYACRPKKASPPGTYARDTSRAATCAECGSNYTAPTASGLYCSPKCRWTAGNRKQAERIASTKALEAPRLCRWCSTSFQRCYGDKRQRYCSERCETARQNATRSGNTHRRRAKKFGVAYEHVNKLRVFERDRWRCQLCLRPVTRADAELDHIVPLSKGGPHTYANTQCACRRCNNAKGDKPIGQQLLFG